ncbi:hypothetical protein EYF80_022397 [Liparis tanakae]|uniref:Uncharacterized protein n=1 Tax=Liparis tanakae TaxID=230148 RepID=A0A4Z2HPF1_9TELE|nr:hypothetical protein EYF80_022397 [Liparis tanakae]
MGKSIKRFERCSLLTLSDSLSLSTSGAEQDADGGRLATGRRRCEICRLLGENIMIQGAEVREPRVGDEMSEFESEKQKKR